MHFKYCVNYGTIVCRVQLHENKRTWQHFRSSVFNVLHEVIVLRREKRVNQLTCNKAEMSTDAIAILWRENIVENSESWKRRTWVDMADLPLVCADKSSVLTAFFTSTVLVPFCNLSVFFFLAMLALKWSSYKRGILCNNFVQAKKGYYLMYY